MSASRSFLAACLLVLVLVLPSAPLHAELRGMPLLQRYSAEDIPATPSHLAITSDDAGVIYVGNVEGVLRFGGGEWDLYELPGGSPARALHKAWDGRIHVGGYDHFGVLTTGPDGQLDYEDLRSRFGLTGAQANVGDVWSVLETSRGLFFRASSRMFFLGRDGATRQWPLGPDVRGFSAVGESLYARVDGIGICRFEDGQLMPLPGAELFATRPLLAVVGRGDALLLASDDGFYESDGFGIRKLASDADAAFAANEPYSSHQLEDGSLVFGSFDGMLTRFSTELQLVDRVPLGANTLIAFGTDREGGLWVASEIDLVRLKLPSPWTAYGADHGLVGSISDTAWYDDTLWVATTVDVMRAEQQGRAQARFIPQRWTRLEAFDLHPSEAGLLVAEREGLQVLDRGATQTRRIAAAETVYLVQGSRHDPERAWALADNELLWLGVQAGRWELIARWPLKGMNANATYETQTPGELWIGDLRGAPQRWRFDPDSGELTERRSFGAESGLTPDPLRGTTLFELDAQLYAVSGARAYRLQGEAFVASDLGPFAGLDRPMEISVVDSPLGAYAWTSRQLLHRAPGTAKWRTLHLDSSLARGFRQVLADADGKLRVITWNGLLQFDPDIPEAAPPALAAGLDQVEVRTPGSEPKLLPLRAIPPPQLPPQSGIRFRFALVTMEPNPSFRYRLVGYTDGWTEWSQERELNYRLLGPGDYRLEVEARTRSGRAATTLVYPFGVRPLWYQTPWAMALAALAGLLAIIAAAQLIVRIRYRQFVSVNRHLEHKISERTRELEVANRKLSELATEDSLTGVANRRALELGLAREWQRCGELRLPLSVVMIDVDHFKQYNDRHGHLDGDLQLQRVAKELGVEVQPVRELLARFGGEEFALILPGLHLDEAMARAERLRQRFLVADIPLTISLGVSSMVPQPGIDPTELLRRADTALYRAKRKGRNRVEAAED